MDKIKGNNFLSLFLFDANYRIGRHTLLILIGAIITFNQVFVAYQDCQSILGNRIYYICFFSFALYLIAMYFNYFFLIPHFLLKNKYIIYSITLSVLVFSLPTLSIGSEYVFRNFFGLPHRITSYFSPLILVDNLATCMITAVCFCGVSVIVLLKNWMSGNEYVNILESEHLKTELNKLKGQITPTFLSKTLRNVSSLVETEPEKATGMLMELSHLLRYQLYDCNRDKIFVKSEISFLIKFLNLEMVNNPGFRYHLHTDENIDNLFVSPMLFISLVQYSIQGNHSLDLSLTFENEWLHFTCQTDEKEIVSNIGFLEMEKRLELQYPGKYTLIWKPGIKELKVAISE